MRADPLVEGDATDRCRAPQRKLAVTVLADDVGVDVLDRDAAAAGEQVTEPRAVEHGARPEHSTIGESSGLDGDGGHDVDRVGDHHDDRVRRHLDERRHQCPTHRFVPRRQVESGLAGFLLRARGDHDQIGVPTHLDPIAPVDRRHRHELGAVGQIEHLGLDPRPVDVMDRHMGGEPAHERRVGDRRADTPRPDDCNVRSGPRHRRSPRRTSSKRTLTQRSSRSLRSPMTALLSSPAVVSGIAVTTSSPSRLPRPAAATTPSTTARPLQPPGTATETVQVPARVNVTCVTPLGDEVASTS